MQSMTAAPFSPTRQRRAGTARLCPAHIPMPVDSRAPASSKEQRCQQPNACGTHRSDRRKTSCRRISFTRKRRVDSAVHSNKRDLFRVMAEKMSAGGFAPARRPKSRQRLRTSIEEMKESRTSRERTRQPSWDADEPMLPTIMPTTGYRQSHSLPAVSSTE